MLVRESVVSQYESYVYVLVHVQKDLTCARTCIGALVDGFVRVLVHVRSKFRSNRFIFRGARCLAIGA